jgi:YidC/Oxa1 family membrane protein insertase
MNFKKNIFLAISIILFACGIVNAEANSLPRITPSSTKPADTAEITAVNAEAKTFTLGSVLKTDPYKLEIVLTTKGAALVSATLRDYDNRNRKNLQPLEMLNSVNTTNSLESARLLLPELGKAFPLDRLNWTSSGVNKNSDGSETISFYAVILKNNSELIKLTKTYTLKPETYLLDCTVTLVNLSNAEIKTSFNMLGPAGISKEDQRIDTRTVTTGFLNSQGLIEVIKLNIKNIAKEPDGTIKLFHKNVDNKFLWTSISNKYFTSIIRPVPTEPNQLYDDWTGAKYAVCFNFDAAEKNNENIGVMIETQAASIAPQKKLTYDFQVYIGPKDRHLFESTKLYNSLGFIKVIDFQACMGDTFSSLSFFILTVMDWIYKYIPNYGVVIIIFVLVVRVLLHPITKRSQVSMMKMAKLGPKSEEIKKKYADNKAEMNKQMMVLYKEHGASPILGCLPMLLQMPIWIALYSAIYAGIEFRGAAFLPFWITDLSGVDALFYFPAAAEKIPFIGTFIGTSFNLLPILLGIAMFLQQKLMPSTAAQSTNPQAAQQQKMMLWMMPVMMLLFLYRAPSGLNLYIMASTTAGVVEQYVIKKHIQEREAAEEIGMVPTTSKLGGKLKKKKPKPPYKFS